MAQTKKSPIDYATSVADVASTLTTFVDKVDANNTYICEALSGTLKSEPFWRIFKVVKNSGITDVMFAESNPNFVHVANDRASYTYL